jgi:hypothetical protein
MYSVKYILGGTEHMIAEHFITPHSFDEPIRGNKRTNISSTSSPVTSPSKNHATPSFKKVQSIPRRKNNIVETNTRQPPAATLSEHYVAKKLIKSSHDENETILPTTKTTTNSTTSPAESTSSHEIVIDISEEEESLLLQPTFLTRNLNQQPTTIPTTTNNENSLSHFRQCVATIFQSGQIDSLPILELHEKLMTMLNGSSHHNIEENLRLLDSENRIMLTETHVYLV